MKTRLFASCAAAVLVLGVAATPASAQQTPATGGLQISEVDNGWVIAPDVQFTQINHRSAVLAGAYGGYDIDHTLLLGGGAYWLTNRNRNSEMQYGGGVVRWTFGGNRPVALTAGALIGGGSATLTRTYADVLGNFPRPLDPRDVSNTIALSTLVRVRDDFFVAEPKVGVLVRLTPWMRLDLGGSYRAVAASRLLEHELRGASGSIGIRIGSH